jgi:molecular chaperone DnaJ|nr:DnaJ domain-containing protein [Candidatus Nitrosocosmicus hydrocola]
MVKLDHYEILGVSNDASYREITSAYRKLALQYHPDRNKSPHANEMMLKINTAYAILSDPHKRNEYDYSVRHAKVKKGFRSSKESTNAYQPQNFSSELYKFIKFVAIKSFRTLILFFKFIQGR